MLDRRSPLLFFYNFVWTLSLYLATHEKTQQTNWKNTESHGKVT